MKIQVLGSGCVTCQKLYELVSKAAKEINLEEEIEYLSGSEGISKIMELGAMSSPLLAIDDQIVMTGFNGDIEKIKALIGGKTKKVESNKTCQCGGNC